MSVSLPNAKVKTSLRRPWLILGGLVLLLLGVLAWLLLFHDAPAPEDADMMPHWSERGGNANPLARFLAAAHASDVYKYAKLPPEVSLLEDRHAWKADEFLREQYAMFTALDELMRTDPATWQWPEPQQLLQFQKAETPEYHDLPLNVAGTLRLKAHRLASLGRVSEAAEQCLLIARFGHEAQGAEGGLVEFTQMMRIQRDGEMQLMKALTSGDASPELLRHCIAELERIEGPDQGGARFALKWGYQRFKHLMSDNHLRRKMLRDTFTKNKAGLMNCFYVKPNHCLMMHLEFDRRLQESLAKGWPQVTGALHADTDWIAALPDPELEPEFKQLLNSNNAGCLIVNAELTDQNKLVEQLVRAVIRNRQLRIELAMRLHELEHGFMPKTLQDLVPDYLPSVPIDEHSGGPMNYLNDSLIVYSVGVDRQDNDGAITYWGGLNPELDEDIGMQYWWRSPFVQSRRDR